MPYDVSWHDEAHSIARMDIYGKVSWDEWHIAVNQLVDMLAASPHRVDFLFFDTVGMPLGNPLPHIKTTMTKLSRHSNMGLIVTVSTDHISAVIKSLLAIASRAAGLKGKSMGEFVNTLDQAMKLINKDRAAKTVR